ncbi:MAG: four helix bundle protein [Elusimicrobiota bacterium]
MDFEGLIVSQEARKLVNHICQITGNEAFRKDFSLKDQIRRASVSVLSNIAEGFERGSNTEFIQYVYIAKGSCAEVRAQLMIASDQRYIDNDIYTGISDTCRKLSCMVNNLIKYLKDSKYPGHKYKK